MDLIYWIFRNPNRIFVFSPCEELDTDERQFLCKTHHANGEVRWWYQTQEGSLYCQTGRVPNEYQTKWYSCTKKDIQ